MKILMILGVVLVLAALVVFGWVFFVSGTNLQCSSAASARTDHEKAKKELEKAQAEGKTEIEIKILKKDVWDKGLQLHLLQGACDGARKVDIAGYVLGSLFGIAGILMFFFGLKSLRKNAIP